MGFGLARGSAAHAQFGFTPTPTQRPALFSQWQQRNEMGGLSSSLHFSRSRRDGGKTSELANLSVREVRLQVIVVVARVSYEALGDTYEVPEFVWPRGSVLHV